MIHHLVAASAITTLASRPLPPPASLAAPTVVRDGDHHDGNGHHNRNIISVHSPTTNRGYQHTSNSNAGGTNPVQNALCRHVTVCTITQKVNITTPERPAPPPTIVPIQAIPEPQRAFAPRPLAGRPVARVPRGPFMYFGSEGFLLMVPGSGTPTAFGSSMDQAFPAGLFG
jgi:hypothetical protein